MNKIATGQQQITAKQQQVAERQLLIAEEQHRLEREREHDRLGPPQPAVIEAEVRDTVVGGRFLAGTITVPRDYRVRGEALVPASRSRQRLALDLVLRANQPVIFQIEDWPERRVAPRTKALHLRFWPINEELDGVPGRPCPCDRPDSDGDGSGSGHWEWTVPVEKRMNPLIQELVELGRRSKRSGDGGDPSDGRLLLEQLIRELQENDDGPAGPAGT